MNKIKLTNLQELEDYINTYKPTAKQATQIIESMYKVYFLGTEDPQHMLNWLKENNADFNKCLPIFGDLDLSIK